MRGYIKPKIAASFILTTAIVFASASQMACGPKKVRDLKLDLLKAAQTLNTAAKTNHSLFESHIISIEARRKAANAIYEANEVLIVALDVVKPLTDATFQQGKVRVLELLSTAAQKLAAGNIGNQTLDLILQSAAAIINTAIVLVQSFTSSILRELTPARIDVVRDLFIGNREVASWAL